MNGDSPVRPSWLPLVDLRPVTRNAQRVNTRITVFINHYPFDWIILGELTRATVNDQTQWVAAYFSEGVTDESHHSAYALWIDLVGLHLSGIHAGVLTLAGWIAGGADDKEAIKVPRITPDLKALPQCKLCAQSEVFEARHPIFGGSSPDEDVELWKRLRGVAVKITIGPPT